MPAVRWDIAHASIRREKLLCAARKRAVRRFSKLRKKDLAMVLRRFDAARHIQRRLRCRRDTLLNTDCPILLEPLPEHFFTYNTADGHRIGYSPQALADYLGTTSSREDPVTRELYSDEDIRRLEAQVGRPVYRGGGAPRERAQWDHEHILGAASGVLDDLASIVVEWADAGTISPMYGHRTLTEFTILSFAPAMNVLSELLIGQAEAGLLAEAIERCMQDNATPIAALAPEEQIVLTTIANTLVGVLTSHLPSANQPAIS